MRVYLKEMEKATRQQVGWLNNKGLMKYSDQRFFTHTLETAQEYIDNSHYFWGIRNEEDQLLGTVAGHWVSDHDFVDLGIMVGRPGQGVGLKAWTEAIHRLHKHHRKIVAGTLAINRPMVTIMERTMIFDYRAKDRYLFEGKPVDGVFYTV